MRQVRWNFSTFFENSQLLGADDAWFAAKNIGVAQKLGGKQRAGVIINLTRGTNLHELAVVDDGHAV